MPISNNLKKAVMETITQHNLFQNGDSVVVGVSGGADSIMLLHILNSLKDNYNLSLKVAHVNHKIRKGDAEKDAAFVELVCKEMGIPFYLKEINIPKMSKELGMSEEEAGHFARYAFFRELAGDNGKIATAHNANDNVETVLMNLMRGTTLQGLQGIAYKNGNIVRPILGISRTEIEEYLSENGLTHITDKTNFEDVYTRNKIRLNLIPYIESAFNGNFVKVLSQNIEGYREDNEFLTQSTNSYFELCCDVKEDKVLISLSDFVKMPISMQKRVLFKAIQMIMNKTEDTNRLNISNDIIQAICNKANSKNYVGKYFVVNSSCVVRFNYVGMVVEEYKNKEKFTFDGFSFKLQEEKVYETPFDFNVMVSFVEEDEIDNTGKVLYLPMSYLGFNCTLRTRRDGDSLRIDDSSSKSLNRFFTDKKVNQDERDSKICLKIGDKIYWVKDLFGTRFKDRCGKFIKLVFEDK